MLRIEFVDDEAQRRARTTVGRGTVMALSAAHRRRRALYVKQPPQPQDQRHQQQLQPQHLEGAHASTEPGQGDLQDSSIVTSETLAPGRPSSAPGVVEDNRRSQSAATATAATVAVAQPAAPLRAGVAAVAAAAAARVRRPDDPEVQAFVERELQAVLLQEDVGMLLQHVLGVLRNVLGGSAGSGASSSRGGGGGGGGVSRLSAPSRYVPASAKRARTATMTPSLPSRQDFENAMAREISSFLVEKDSLTFVGQLYLFLASGLTVRGYDESVFGPEEAARGVTAKVAEGKYSSAGPDRQVSSEVVDLADDDGYQYDAFDDDFDSG
ncbi:hypothetical protein VOLCADRAFT_99651 [Volvox carteri f. nagariensis]|uniref:Uncharacterized protein n=1 Tax=Volvox carteri f. nagariensis TaxID=3068 RepID=D8UIA0_VOLCA|nr:uncharacterized protein VOLCADRAFT_99651 [Volvox carteri f. nagariensis]EFJ40552.1 hypothetical protein VOLCADRAFT_99651 [Volvox carteri f. nagariensis]|eukprot:XP_002958402.1 hypothetical protein VOLCADRAFT_99651 [Volvox carteri f. nagariensis]